MNGRLRVVSLGLIALGLLVLVVVWVRVQPSHPVALIRVVDPNGKPVVGAKIEPDGLRPKNNGGHYLWTENGYSVKPAAVTTDKEGYARVGYPAYVAERLETGEISFAVNHPDFVPDRPFRKVSITPTAGAPWRERLKFWVKAFWHRPFRADPVVLCPGAVLRVAAYSGSPPLVVSNFVANISGMWTGDTDTWKQLPDGSLFTRRVPPGHRMLQLISTSNKDAVRFSEVVEFDAKAGQTNEYRLELNPGLRLVGKLDDKVPRPVSGGRVTAEVWPEIGQPGPGSFMWSASSEVNSNGDFVLEPLPPGQLEIVGICDGFISANGPPKPNYSAVRIPQLFSLPGADQPIRLKMEATAALKVTVLDDEGRPLPGATVSFWPNVVWGGFGTRLLSDGGLTLPFAAVSASNGVALVRNLPIEATEYAVSHAQFEMHSMKTPWGTKVRVALVSLAAGQTNETVVRLQKSGTETIRN